jgi:hypothetical protein
MRSVLGYESIRQSRDLDRHDRSGIARPGRGDRWLQYRWNGLTAEQAPFGAALALALAFSQDDRQSEWSVRFDGYRRTGARHACEAGKKMVMSR